MLYEPGFAFLSLPHTDPEPFVPGRHAAVLAEMRGILDAWMEETNDQGKTPEPEEVYDADMAVYFESRANDPERTRIFAANVAQMKTWAAKGM